MSRQKIWLVLLLLILAGALRFYRLNILPPSLNWDEVSHGYNAYSILKTGKDEWGVRFPLLFRAFGDYKLPVYVYLTVLSEAVFGLSAWAVRIPSALAGVGSVFIFYLLVRKLFGDFWLAWVAAFLLAVSPWDLFLSRAALEGNMALFLVLLGVFCLEKKRFGVGFAALALSLQTYYVARMFVPLFLVGWLIIGGRQRLKEVVNKGWVGLGLLALSLGIAGYQTVLGHGAARYGLISLIDQGTVARIGQIRATIPLRGPFPRLFVNKLTVGVVLFFRNYLEHFSPTYLFTSGGTNFQFSLPGYGLLYPIDFLFLAIGIFSFVGRYLKEHGETRVNAMLVLWWLTCGPVASSLTRDAPHPLRSLVLLPAVLVIVGFGVAWAIRQAGRQRRYLSGLIIIIFVFVHGLYLFDFWTRYNDYARKFSWVWQYGYAQVVESVKARYSDEKVIAVSKKYGEPHEFFLWYWPWNPARYQGDPRLVRYFRSDWYWVDSFDKLLFVNDWEVKQKESSFVIPGETLLVTSPGNYSGGSLVKTIRFLDGTSAFDVVQF